VRFIKKDEYYAESECGGYRVTRDNRHDPARYLAWLNTRRKNSYGEDIWEQVGEYSTNFKQTISNFKGDL